MNEIDKKNLIIDISDNYFVIAACELDENFDLKVVEEEKIVSNGIQNGKIINLEESTETLKKGISKIEEKINFIFRKAYIVLNQSDVECINICGFKKLNGNQILSEDISYILNDIKTKINEVELKKSILHIFNTEFILDKKIIKNLPIGLFGDFYSHQLTFFLTDKNETNNFQKLLNNCNLNLERIIFSKFTDGIKIIKKEKVDTFIKIKINKDNSQLIFFKNSAFNFYQNFKFGSDIILQDVSKVCSLNSLNTSKVFSNICFDKINDDKHYLDKDYFQNQSFRKISLEHIKNIADARIKEIIDIILNENKNLKYIKLKDMPILLLFEDEKIFLNLNQIFKQKFRNHKNLIVKKQEDDNTIQNIKVSAELISKGWVSEAIPVIQKKKSFISRIFSVFFK